MVEFCYAKECFSRCKIQTTNSWFFGVILNSKCCALLAFGLLCKDKQKGCKIVLKRMHENQKHELCSW